MGRGAFSAKHERNIGIAIVLFIIGLVGALLLAGGVTGTVARAAYMQPGQAEQVIQDAFNGLLVGSIVLGIVAGLASVFFLWELLNLSGRGLILLSYVSAILIACVVFVLIDAQLGGALASAFSATPPDVGPLIALDAEINGLRLLDAIPSLLQAGAAFIAWSRLASGEIPKWHP